MFVSREVIISVPKAFIKLLRKSYIPSTDLFKAMIWEKPDLPGRKTMSVWFQEQEWVIYVFLILEEWNNIYCVFSYRKKSQYFRRQQFCVNKIRINFGSKICISTKNSSWFVLNFKEKNIFHIDAYLHIWPR